MHTNHIQIHTFIHTNVYRLKAVLTLNVVLTRLAAAVFIFVAGYETPDYVSLYNPSDNVKNMILSS